MNMNKDIWNGYITELDEVEITCILRKGYNCDKELVVGRALLTKEQNDMVSLGLVIRFNLAGVSDGDYLTQIEFMLEDGSWI